VWEKRDTKREKIKLPTTHPDWEWSTPDDADFSLRRVGAKAGTPNWELNYSAASNHFIKSDNEDLFDRFLELEDEFELVKHDTAGNPSIGKAEFVLIYTKRFG
jgi:hypothetical protein